MTEFYFVNAREDDDTMIQVDDSRWEGDEKVTHTLDPNNLWIS